MEPVAPKEPCPLKTPRTFRRRPAPLADCSPRSASCLGGRQLADFKDAAAHGRPASSPANCKAPRMLPKTPRATSRATSNLNPLIAKRFEFVRKLGEGAFGKIDLVRDRNSGQERTCKVIDTLGMKRAVLEQMKKEIEILSSLEHSHIVRIFHYVEDKQRFQLILILEYIPGGGCDSLLKRMGCLNELLAARLVRQLLTAVSHCHSRGIVHRDIKPEHMMVVQPEWGSSQDVKIIDFGLAANADDICGRRLDRTGTPAYMAPEVVNREAALASKADMWSIGVCALELLTGQSVFLGESLGETYEKIQRYTSFEDIKATFHKNPGWRRLSREAKDFVRSLLDVDPNQRLDAPEALAHPWVVKIKTGAAGSVGEVVQGLAMYARASPVIRSCLQMIVRRSEAAGLEGHMAGLTIEGDCNGKASCEDVLAAIGQSVGFGADKVDVAALLRAAGLDRNGGKVCLVELAAACLHTKYSSIEDIAISAFRAADANRDGFVALMDVVALLGSQQYSVTAVLPQDRPFNREEWCQCLRVSSSPVAVSKLRLCVTGVRALSSGGGA